MTKIGENKLDLLLNKYEVADIKKAHPYYSDSLKSMNESNGEAQKIDLKCVSRAANKKDEGAVANFFAWVKGFFWNSPSDIEPVDSITKTESLTGAPQKELDIFTEEMKKINQRIQDLNDEYEQLIKTNPNAAESTLMKLLTLLVKSQLKNKELSALFANEKVKSNQSSLKGVLDQTKINNEELAALNDKYKWVNRVNGVFSVLAPITAGIGIVVSVSTLGGAIPIVIAAMGVITSLAQAGTTLFKGVTEDSLSAKQKESYLLNAQKELAKEGITVGVNEIDQAFKEIADYWANLKDIADKQRQAQRIRI